MASRPGMGDEVNRAERRAAKRAMGGHLDCGCKPRLLVPVERAMTCPDCRYAKALHAFPLPTSADLGSLSTFYVSCDHCPNELEVVCSVEAL